MHILNYDDLSISKILRNNILTTLKLEGAVLLKDSGSFEQFKEISNLLSSRFMPYIGGSNHGRKLVDKTAKIMTAPGGKHNNAIQLHGEMCYQNSRPDLLFFFCDIPASSGGETIYADGIELYEKISEDANLQDLLTKRVCYHRKRTPDAWQNLYSTNNKQSVIDYCQHERIQAEFSENNILYTRYTDTLIHQSSWSDKPIFINNLLGFSQNAMKRKEEIYSWITYENDSAIPQNLISNLQNIVAKYTYHLNLKQNDILILDNHRILHGRLAFSDENRKILLRMGLY